MLEQRQILPIGSTVSVQYKKDGGKETVLVIVGHLSLCKGTVCYYDYICVRFPYGTEKGILYINHSDIVRVIYTQNPTDAEYMKWLERKIGEYDTYYKHYQHIDRPDIDTVREQTVKLTNQLDETLMTKKLKRTILFGIILTGAGLTAFLTGEWHVGVCALLFALLGFLTR